MHQSDTEKTVKEFLELWQKQFAHISRDEKSVGQGIRMLQHMHDAYLDACTKNVGNKDNAASSVTSDIFGNIGNELIRLAESYAQLEARITKLESGAAAGGGNPAGEARQDRPGRAGGGTAKAGK